MGNIIDEVTAAVDNMDEATLRAEFARITKEREERKVKQKEYNASPEAKAKRKAYSEEYRKKNPDKFKEQRKAYMQKPEVKQRMKAYRQKRQANEKAILARAKELGITGAPATPAQPSA